MLGVIKELCKSCRVASTQCVFEIEAEHNRKELLCLPSSPEGTSVAILNHEWVVTRTT